MNLKKPFKTFKEQVELLKNRGLEIVNSSHLENNLKKYNYQIFINGYNDPFLSNFENRNSNYEAKCTDQMIKALFDFDRKLGNYLLHDILNFERILSTALCYKIMEKINGQYNGDSTFENLDFNDDFWIDLFSNSFSYLDINNNHNSKKVKLIYDKFIKGFSEIYKQNKEKKLFSGYKNFKQIPLYKLFVYLTLGDLQLIFGCINSKIQAEIITEWFSRLGTIHPSTFLYIIDLIRRIRNIVVHNEVLYNFNNKSYKVNKNIRGDQGFNDLTNELNKILKRKVWSEKFKILHLAIIIFRLTNNIKTLEYIDYAWNILKQKITVKKSINYIKQVISYNDYKDFTKALNLKKNES